MDNLEVSTDNSDSEYVSNFQSAKISIQPPVNANSENRDKDQPTGDASTLIGNQLLNSAVLQVNTPSGRVARGDEEEQSNKNEKLDNCQLKATKQGKTRNHYAHNWRHGDMLSQFTWKLEAPIVDKSDLLTTLFKMFFTDDIL